MTTILEGMTIALLALPVAVFAGWLFRDDPPKPEPEPQWRCVARWRDGHTFIVIYHDDNIEAAIEALCNLAVSSRTELNLTDANLLADDMEWRRV